MEQIVNNPRDTNAIQRLNDALRCEGRGGMMVMTNGVAALPVADVNRIFEEVRCFVAFTPENDPFGEHDCAVQVVGNRRILWKIDYYDRSRTRGSPDPTNPKLTCRVMTVMLAEEY